MPGSNLLRHLTGLIDPFMRFPVTLGQKLIKCSDYHQVKMLIMSQSWPLSSQIADNSTKVCEAQETNGDVIQIKALANTNNAT